MTPCPRQEIKEKETALSVEQADLDSDGLTSFWNTRWWTLRIEICFKKMGNLLIFYMFWQKTFVLFKSYLTS